MKLSRYEQESILNYNAGEQTATLYTRDKAVMRRLDTLVADFPDTYKLAGQDEVQNRKNEVLKMIGNKQEVSRDLEKALQALQQAKQRVANEKKKQNEKKHKAENHHKYIMGGIIVKYFPDCYRYDEGELNRILSVALQTRECQQIISKIKTESRETTPPQSTVANAENESEGGTE